MSPNEQALAITQKQYQDAVAAGIDPRALQAIQGQLDRYRKEVMKEKMMALLKNPLLWAAAVGGFILFRKK